VKHIAAGEIAEGKEIRMREKELRTKIYGSWHYSLIKVQGCNLSNATDLIIQQCGHQIISRSHAAPPSRLQLSTGRGICKAKCQLIIAVLSDIGLESYWRIGSERSSDQKLNLFREALD
jgi:hypothetical protein